jgi:hypothetical protein
MPEDPLDHGRLLDERNQTPTADLGDDIRRASGVVGNGRIIGLRGQALTSVKLVKGLEADHRTSPEHWPNRSGGVCAKEHTQQTALGLQCTGHGDVDEEPRLATIRSAGRVSAAV